MSTHYRLLNILCIIFLAFGFLPVHSAQASTYREIVAQLPLSPIYTQPVRVWMNSDTLPGEVAGLAYQNFNTGWTYMVLATYNNTTYPGANWYTDIPTFPVGTNVALQLYTQGVDGINYGYTGFITYYVVQDLPATVYVDDHWVGTMAGADPDGTGPATNFGGDAFTTIHEGISGMAAGGTLHVAAGNYYESDLLINKSLSLVGAGVGQTIIGPKVTDAHQCNPLTSAHQGIIIAANNVSLQGFTLDGNADGALTGDHNYRMGITTQYASTTYHNLTVQDVAIQHAWYRGVMVRAKSGETSSGHIIDHVTINDLAGCKLAGEPRKETFGILYYDAAGEISNSSVTSAGSGIAASNSTATPLLANIHHNAVTNVDVQAYSLTFNAAGTIFENNTALYENTSNNGIALLVDQPQGFTIRNNTFNGAKSGIFVGRQTGPVGQFVIGEGNQLVGPGATVTGSRGILADGTSVAANINTNFIVEKTTITHYFAGILLDRSDNNGTSTVVVRSNQILENGTGLFMGRRTSLTLHHNRFLGNLTAGVGSTQSLTAENNWWGCNEGPSNADCNHLTGPVDADPWLVLSAGALDSSITPSTTTQIQSDLLHNSAAQDTSANGFVPDGIPAVFSAPDGGSLTLTGSATLNGALEDVTFSPPTINQTYRTCVSLDNEQVCANVTVENVAPLAVADSYVIDEDTLLSVPAPGLLANDSDANQTTLTAVLDVDAPHGNLILYADGSFTYLPDENWFGSDSFTYKASDGGLESEPVTVSITITGINDAPLVSSQSVSLLEDSSKVIHLVATDGDNDPLTWTVSNPLHGTLSGSVPDLTYTPSPNFYGSDLFTFRVNDGQVDSNLATVTITVTPVNDPPVAYRDSYIIARNGVLTVLQPGVLANDTDVEGSLLRAYLISGVEHGTLTFNLNGSFVYVPTPGWSGADGFIYYASDGELNSAPQMVSLNVTSTNTPPLASPDSYSVAEDNVLVVPAPGLLANDSDADGNPLLAILKTQPAHGVVTVNLNGSFTYTPNADFNGEDLFYYAAYDGLAYSADQAVTLTITPVNDPPVAQNDAYFMNEDVQLNVDSTVGLLGNDTDVEGDNLTAILVSTPEFGDLVLNVDGSFSYSPDVNFFGEDSFTYQASDGSLGSNTVTVTITVNPVNDPPVADDQTVTAWTNGILLGVLTASDVDNPNLSFSLTNPPNHGSVEVALNGAFSYLPAVDYIGTDRFFFTVSDGEGGTDTGKVTVTVVLASRVWLPMIVR
jgi:VCBS repeat-containing protein